MKESQFVRMVAVLQEVQHERLRQHEKWGEQDHPDGTGGRWKSIAEDARKICDEQFALGAGTYCHILTEEVAEALAETDALKLRTELVQVSAVACAWVEAIDRRLGLKAWP